MIEHIRGMVDCRNLDSVVVDAAGIGYRVFVPVSSLEKIPMAGMEVKLFVVESTAMYGGSTTLYGFLTQEERNIFLLLKESVPGAGAKKAMDYLDKVTKSLPDFRRVILAKDTASLTGIFGFTKKTAEKLVASLKDKIGDVTITGKEKWVKEAAGSVQSEAVSGLVSIGYRENQARDAVAKALENGSKELSVQEAILEALKHL